MPASVHHEGVQALVSIGSERSLSTQVVRQGDDASLPDVCDVVLVLGVHRSGTSAVAELIGRNGGDLGDEKRLLGANKANPHGHFENLDVKEFDQGVLERLDGDWWAPPLIESVEVAVDDFVADARKLWRRLRPSYVHGVPVIKDPRLSLLLPLWRRVLGPDVLHVVCLRDPLAVARSLQARNGFALEVGLALWETYTIACLRGLTGSRALFVDVDGVSRDRAAREVMVAQVRSALGLTGDEIDDSLDPNLLGPRSTSQELAEHLTGSQLALQRSLEGLPRDVVLVDSLEHLRVPAVTARRLIRHRQLAGELADATARVTESERAAGQAKEQLSGLEAEVDRLRAEAGKRQEIVERLRRDLARRGAEVEELRSENDRLEAAADDSAAQRLRLDHELGALRAKFASDADKAAPLTDELARLTDETAGLRASLAARDIELQDANETLSSQAEQVKRLEDEIAATHLMLTDSGGRDEELVSLRRDLETEQAQSRLTEDIATSAKARNDKLERQLQDATRQLTGLRQAVEMARAESARAKTPAGDLRRLARELETERQSTKALAEKAQEAEAQLVTAKSLLTALRDELAASKEAEKVAEEAVQRHQAELHSLNDMYGAVFDSRSWRWTKPLRRERTQKATP
jgi:hypothetical protein